MTHFVRIFISLLCPVFHLVPDPLLLLEPPPPTPHLAGDSTLNFGTHMVSISHAFLTPDLRSMINTMIWGQFTFRPSRGGGWVSVLRTPGPLGEEDWRYRDIYYYLLRNYIALRGPPFFYTPPYGSTVKVVFSLLVLLRSLTDDLFKELMANKQGAKK